MQARDVLVFYDKPEEFLRSLTARFPDLRFHCCRSYADLDDTVANVQPQIAFACKFEPKPFPRAALVNCPSLQWLAVGFAGVDHVVPWDDDRLKVTNASGVAAEEMAQYVLAAIFGLHQRFPYFARRWRGCAVPRGLRSSPAAVHLRPPAWSIASMRRPSFT
jgi:phosphoglycerate dehydrogenase-like enzyme